MSDPVIVKCCGTYPLIDRPKGCWLIECQTCHKSSGVHVMEHTAWQKFTTPQIPEQTTTDKKVTK